MPAATVPMVTTDGQRSTLAPVSTSPVPEFPSTLWVDDIITVTSSPKRTSGGRSLKTRINLTETEPTPSPPPFIPSSKKENNSVDEVSYRIVGLDSDITRGQQSYFVPRMPPFRERTQNKRIQELLNEKRRQDLLRRPSRSRVVRTERKHAGL
eukprot:superscaffoldBa00008502_g23400